MTRKPIIATYRLQVHHQFNFSAVGHILKYLKQLGISDLYLSPITTATPGSLHGYDVVNSQKINPELGNLNEWQNLVKKAKSHDMGFVLDIVPNHMAYHENNAWLQDVLKHQQDSIYAHYFDLNFGKDKGARLRYRRFFDINELICLHAEYPDVFTATHQLFFKLMSRETDPIIGLRVDHIDGLYDPTAYLKILRQHLTQNKYLFVEKILSKQEALPATWPIDGATGYEFLNHVNSVFVSSQGYRALVKHYRTCTHHNTSWETIRYLNKKKVIQKLFLKEFNHLCERLKTGDLAPWMQAFSQADLLSVLSEITAHLTVYRTYQDSQPPPSRQDQKYIRMALKKAAQTLSGDPRLQNILQCFERLLLLKKPYPRQAVIDWIKQWQVFTGPVMAKGFEDTTCYVYNPLISLNEVGSDPAFAKQLGCATSLHRFLKKRAHLHPHALNATTTHDTKHSEDFRMRVNVLSWHAQAWQDTVEQWMQNHTSYRTQLEDRIAPDPAMEILIYQLLIGMYPVGKYDATEFQKRLFAYLTKAAREAKLFSSWQQPNETYEKALCDFTQNILKDSHFQKRFTKWQTLCSAQGKWMSISQLLIKIFAPGIPDFYQGSEGWDFRVTDPDNRNVIDYAPYKKLLKTLIDKEAALSTKELFTDLRKDNASAALKLFFMQQGLKIRTQWSELFTQGNYIPLMCTGRYAHHIFAFGRVHQKQIFILVVPIMLPDTLKRNGFPLGKIWQDTAVILPKNDRNQFQSLLDKRATEIKMPSGDLRISQLFMHIPFGLGILQ